MLNKANVRARARGLYRAALGKRRNVRDDLSLRRSAVVFAPHPDDETLGCGGTIVRKIRAGARVRLVVMTDGGSSHRELLPAGCWICLDFVIASSTATWAKRRNGPA
jgi:hypothetical protein